eukprot:6205664-Pleurochrysis_carterae.AAC.8
MPGITLRLTPGFTPDLTTALASSALVFQLALRLVWHPAIRTSTSLCSMTRSSSSRRAACGPERGATRP